MPTVTGTVHLPVEFEVPDPQPNRVNAVLQWDVTRTWLDWLAGNSDPTTLLVLASTNVTPGVWHLDGTATQTLEMYATADLLGKQWFSGQLITDEQLTQAPGHLFVVTCDEAGNPVLTFPAA